jgi:hypothetical protein
MRRFAKSVSLAILLLAVSLPAFAGDKVSVKIINGSSWDVHHLFLSPVSDEAWGADQLRDNIIQSGEAFTITGIPCDSYDVKVVDEDGDECVIEEVDLCNADKYWKITDDDLLECEGYGND